MPQSLAQIYVHLVFSTKNRTPFLTDAQIRQALHRYLGGTCNNLDCQPLTIGGVEDHVHLLVQLGRTCSIAGLVKELKQESSKWVKTKSPALQEFFWQNGYGAFSISPSHVPDLRQYIDVQEEHHRTETYQEEFRRLLGKYGLEWDERYVWD